MMPEELKNQLIAAYHVASDVVLGDVLVQAFDAGVASVPGGGGFTQEQMDLAVSDAKAMVKEAAKLAVDAHDANTMVDQDLKNAIDAIV